MLVALEYPPRTDQVENSHNTSETRSFPLQSKGLDLKQVDVTILKPGFKIVFLNLYAWGELTFKSLGTCV